MQFFVFNIKVMVAKEVVGGGIDIIHTIRQLETGD
jgi:hypothetical protein